MGTELLPFGAGGGGSSSNPPTDTPDNLRSKALLSVIEIVSEGPIKGLVNGGQSVFYSGTPLQNSDGSVNFRNTKLNVRYGGPNQPPVGGFPDVETEISVGQKIESYTNHLASVVVTNQGSGYTTATVQLGYRLGGKGDGLTHSQKDSNGATSTYVQNFVPSSAPSAHAVIVGGKITQIIVDDGGANIISQVTVTITGDGTGATAFAELGGGIVRTIDNLELDAVNVTIKTNAFLSNTTTGDILNTNVQFMVQVKSQNGYWQTPYYASAFTDLLGAAFSPFTTALSGAASLVVPPGSPYSLGMQYRAAGASTWQSAGTYAGTNTSNAPETHFPNFRATGLGKNQYETRFTEQYGNSFTSNGVSYHDPNALITLNGKTSSGFAEDFKMILPPGEGPWQIRAMRMSGDPIDDHTQNIIFFDSYTEITEAKMIYPDTAYFATQMDSEFVGSSPPSRSYEIYGRLVRVPSNYNPDTRAYTGIWDGSFVEKYSNNPVWCFLDMLTHERYGLGQWVDDSFIDFAALYQIAQYCDELVEDGNGGYEPRFTLNTQIMNAVESYSMLNNLATAFRGMIYWAAGWVSLAQDAPRPVSRTVAPANVINGDFNYVGTARKARHSVALIKWNDPDDEYRLRTEIYEEPDLIARYGYVTTEVNSMGITSRALAIRFGKWLLDSERFATDVVSYKAGWDHADCLPGEVVAVADPAYSGIRQGGRIASATNSSIILDAPYTYSPNETYTLTVALPTWGKVSIMTGTNTIAGTRTAFTSPFKQVQANDVIMLGNDPEQYQIQSVDGSGQLTLVQTYTKQNLVNSDYVIFRSGVILYASINPIVDVAFTFADGVANADGTYSGKTCTLATALPAAPQANTPFIITGSDVAPRLFRVVSNKEGEKGVFEITAVAYDPTKYDRVEKDIKVTQVPTYVDYYSKLLPAADLTASEGLYLSNNQVRSRIVLGWRPSPDPRCTSYRCSYKLNDSPWTVLRQSSDTSAELDDSEVGQYYFKVEALSQIGVPSDPIVSPVFNALGKTAPPADVQNFVAERTLYGVQLSWDQVTDLDVVGYEIRDGLSWDDGVVLTNNLRGQSFFVGLSDTTVHHFHIKAIDDTGNYSQNPSAVSTSIADTPDVTGFTVTPDNDRLIFRWNAIDGQSITYEIREGTTFSSGKLVGQFTATDANVMYPINGERKFWLKAISQLGFYSVNASIDDVTVNTPQIRNQIYTLDQSAAAWAGSNYNVTPTGLGSSELKIADGYLTGYTVFQIDLGGRVRARCWYDADIFVDEGTPTWAQATFAWGDLQSLSTWRPKGLLGNARVDVYIAPDNASFDTAIVGLWPLNTDLTDVIGNTAPTAGVYASDSGVLDTGYASGDQRPVVTYTYSVPTTFSFMIDAMFKNIAANFGAVGDQMQQVELIKFTGTGRLLRLMYFRAPTPCFTLTDGTPANDLTINWPGDSQLRLSLAIVQSATDRRLYLYDHDSTLSAQVTNSVGPVGGYTQIQM